MLSPWYTKTLDTYLSWLKLKEIMEIIISSVLNPNTYLFCHLLTKLSTMFYSQVFTRVWVASTIYMSLGVFGTNFFVLKLKVIMEIIISSVLNPNTYLFCHLLTKSKHLLFLFQFFGVANIWRFLDGWSRSMGKSKIDRNDPGLWISWTAF
jgi:hypothetical protein